MSQQPATGTVIGHLKGGAVADRHSGRKYIVQLVADANGDALNAQTGIRYRLRRVWI